MVLVCDIINQMSNATSAGHLIYNMKYVLLEQESGVDVECAVAVLFLYYRILAELAYRQAILECNDEVLVHDEAQATTYCDVWTVACEARECHVLIVCLAVLLLATERHVVIACNHCTVAEDVQAERNVLLAESEADETPT